MRYFLWGHMKSLTYECRTEIDMGLVARIAVVANGIPEMPGVFANVHQSLFHRCKACIIASGRFFYQFLQACILIRFLLIKDFLKYLLSFLC